MTSSRSAFGTALFSLALLAASPAAAFGPFLVRDIDPTPPGRSAGSPPTDQADLGAVSLFLARDGSHGEELWATDGTPAGTRLVEDVCPGPCDSEARFIAVGGGRLFFYATRADRDGFRSARQLWVSDGTPAGTRQLTSELLLDPSGDREELWSDTLGLLLFIATDDAHGLELWASDGTAAGTGFVADLNPGPASSSPQYFAEAGRRVLFSAFDAAHGRELWVTDGTAGGTSLLEEIAPGAGSSTPSGLLALGGRVVFTAAEPAGGRELWASDGTAFGTSRVRDLRPGPDSSGILLPMVRSGPRAFFVADDGSGEELWATDGTGAGTVELTAFIPAQPFGGLIFFGTFLAAFDGSVAFVADDGQHGQELWVSDGTVAGTRRISDACPGPCSATPYSAERVGDTLYFLAEGGVSGIELWASDLTLAGTRRQVADLCPGPCDSQPALLGVVGGELLFFAPADSRLGLWRTAGPAAAPELFFPFESPSPFLVSTWQVARGVLLFTGFDPEHGAEPWVSDGTTAGTHLLRDIGSTGGQGSRPTGLLAAGERVWFVADDGTHGRELWSSDGTAGSTLLLAELIPGSGFVEPPRVFPVAAWRGRTYFVAELQETGRELWATDGTAAGAVRLTDSQESPFASFEPAGGIGRNFFFGTDEGLLKTDGTLAGTSIVSTVETSNNRFFLSNFAGFKGRIVFRGAAHVAQEVELWVSDGTTAGTRMLKDVEPGPSVGSQPGDFTPVGNTLFFTATTSAEGRELWKTDGTTGGTVPVADVSPGREHSEPRELTPFGGRLFFVATRPDVGQELWMSDGTAAGTVLVKDVRPGPASSLPRELTVVGNRLFFVAGDGVHGRELWASDGTPAGTVLVRDVAPGPGGSALHSLTAAFGRLLFAASDGERGLETWSSDGTAAGTALVHDFAPGPASSNPHELTVAGSLVYFVADDNVLGAELWALCPSPRPVVSLTNARVRERDEAAAALTFQITLSHPFCAAVRVNYATPPGTATAGTDYLFTNGRLTFPPGTTSRPVPVQVLGDDLPEADETFFLRLARPENASIGRPRARGLVLDDDRP